ncbi:DNA-(apurinic or apyrimidinic site) lyase-like [Amborella trichopoda]|uniref:DNA-(apurinic or apyrimidinic site) lyase-like n=1 Tax=Amborella trichopoda TaxID=13333 RepID=UPI0005D3738D|nr:DNA-(apurinic or apyrimidinic site) lyase-like [Amborella trichopoda]|eukprot:XP_011622431.1 DNA-(apurinic or apyrimidinic site) lyase-like [Amborella trichopoda]
MESALCGVKLWSTYNNYGITLEIFVDPSSRDLIDFLLVLEYVLIRAISSPPFRNYRVWLSLANTKYGGTTLFIKKTYFNQRRCPFLMNIQKVCDSKNESDGQVILAKFDYFCFLNAYVPNGWKDDDSSFKRRRKWDKRKLEFVCHSSDKPLIWCRDQNVSHQDIDVSHPEFFSSAKLNGYVLPNKEEDCGQPGFTIAERQRFSTILSEGKLLDAYRFLHKEQDLEGGFSWSGNPVDKYKGKRMRIDYFLVSEKPEDKLVACEIYGKGIEIEGFNGSNDCLVSLELSLSMRPMGFKYMHKYKFLLGLWHLKPVEKNMPCWMARRR